MVVSCWCNYWVNQIYYIWRDDPTRIPPNIPPHLLCFRRCRVSPFGRWCGRQRRLLRFAWVMKGFISAFGGVLWIFFKFPNLLGFSKNFKIFRLKKCEFSALKCFLFTENKTETINFLKERQEISWHLCYLLDMLQGVGLACWQWGPFVTLLPTTALWNDEVKWPQVLWEKDGKPETNLTCSIDCISNINVL